MLTQYQIKRRQMDEKVELEKLQRNRSKANKTKKSYWQNRIDEFFLEGMK